MRIRRGSRIYPSGNDAPSLPPTATFDPAGGVIKVPGVLTREQANAIREQVGPLLRELDEAREYANGADAEATQWRGAAERAMRAVDVLRDIAEHGLRCDLTPTVLSPWAGDYGWWTNYLRSADNRIRERARAALEDVAVPAGDALRITVDRDALGPVGPDVLATITADRDAWLGSNPATGLSLSAAGHAAALMRAADAAERQAAEAGQ